MEMVPHALIALLVLMHLLDPLPLLLVFARKITSELETELHAVSALAVEPLLSKRQSQLLPLRTLTALARQTSMEMVPHALIALLALTHLLDPLPLLLAFARPTSMELETEQNALLAPKVRPLLCKRQSQILPLRTLTAHAQPTPTGTAAVHAQIALLVLMHLLDPLRRLLAFAMLATLELEMAKHARHARKVKPLLSRRLSQLLPRPLKIVLLAALLAAHHAQIINTWMVPHVKTVRPRSRMPLQAQRRQMHVQWLFL
jgi:hypothetical protein